MLRSFYLIFLFFSSSFCFAQENVDPQIDAYWDIGISANVWPNEYKTVGAQVTGGAIINKRITVGAGLGISSREYEYIHIPIEVGYVIWRGNGAVRVYGGPTFGTYYSGNGFLGGTEIVFRPRFDMRNLKLLLALGLAFDQSVERNFGFGRLPSTSERTVLPGPRIRIGLAL